MTTTTRPIAVGPFNLGVNHRLPDTQLKVPRVGTFLRSAVNVDVSDAGTIGRRTGYALALAGTDVHSLYSFGEHAYVVDGTVLYRLSGSPAALTQTAVRTGLRPGQALSYEAFNDRVVYTDGLTVRRLDGLADKPLGVPMMERAPTVLAAGSGSLAAGRYQVCFTYISDELEQSGTTQPIQVDAVENSSILIGDLPAAFPTGVAGVAIYMTQPNGDQLYFYRTLTTAASTHAIPAPPALTGRVQTLLMRPLPGGSIIRHNIGRLLVAKGKVLFYSEPFAPALHYPHKNFIPFDTEITVVESLETGTYVATEDATYFFAGDIADAEAKKVLPYGAVPGTGGVSPDRLKCWWMSVRGLVQASEQGVVNVQEKNVAVNPAAAGASLYREQNGLKQVVTSLFGTEATGASAYTFMDAEIIRKGTIL